MKKILLIMAILLAASCLLISCGSNSDMSEEEMYEKVYDEIYDEVFDEIYDDVYDKVYETMYNDMFDEVYDAIYDDIYNGSYNDIYNEVFDEIYDEVYDDIYDEIYAGVYDRIYEYELYEEETTSYDDEDEDDLTKSFLYKVENGKVIITKYEGSDENVVIPETIEGYPVVSIGAEAFMRNETIKSVKIPDSVEIIQYDAFNECKNLAEIDFSNATIIGERAFAGTAWLNAQPDGLVILGEILIVYKGEMPENTSITIPNTVTSIANGAFSEQKNLTNIVIPDSVTEIGEDAFYLSGLKSVELSKNITEIKYNTFAYCDKLESITIPFGVKSIAASAFECCGSLTYVEIPNSVTEVSYYVFAGTEAEIIVPDSVVSVGNSAFSGCTIDEETSKRLLEINEYAFG